MHCLGAVAGSTASPNGVGSCGGVVGVIRALGVLVSEGRVQGAPRGYKEGPHCAAPLQTVPNDHACEKDNYLCDRYLVLIREITDRISIGSYLCVEVLLCSDCPCGHAKATCKDPVFPVSSMSIASWQHSSEMLLEYWCINVVPSKGQEMMNSHGLYQAVRSRLHFSQVAAWWSRSKGANPSFVATRIVPHTEDNLRKFREPPIEHTFPLAGSSDGNSIKVTVWALPRMEEVPVLTCPMHPAMEKDEEGAARALTPTKNISVPTVTQNPETLVLPALVDDRLQTPCNEPGKHHCRCEEEDGCPPSPSIRPNNERKRRRSLPCGPADSDSCFAYHSIPLPSVQERATSEKNARQANCFVFPNSSHSSDHSKYSECPNYRGANAGTDQGQTGRSDENAFVNCSTSDAGGFERCFATMLNIDKHEGNIEKRYKPTIENSDSGRGKSFARHGEKSPKFGKKMAKNSSSKKIESPETTVPLSLSLRGNWTDSSEDHLFLVIPENEVETFQRPKERYNGVVSRSTVPPVPKETNLVVNPFRERSPFHESNPGPSTYSVTLEPKPCPTVPACAVHQSRSRTSPTVKSDVTDRLASLKNTALSSEQTTKRSSTRKCSTPEKNLSQLMSQLSFPEEKDSSKEEGGILDWISKVPGRVLGVATNNAFVDEKSKTRSAKICDVHGNEAKTKNCNLELSQREFDEVLAVLRARTPSGRRRTPLRTTKRRDRPCGETISNKTLKSPSTNVEACQYPSNSETNCSTIPCDGHDGSPCKKVCEIPAKPVWINSRNCNGTDQHGAELQEKLTSPNTTREFNEMEKQANKSTDVFYNVSNKADLLLGAILRSSKERKGLSDFSNGTRPRFSLSPSKSENESIPQKDTAAKNINQGLKIVPLLEDEKSSPSTFNKRFHLFRQLFIKEQERKEILTSEIHSKDSLQNSQQRPYTSKLNNSCGNVRQQVQSRQKAKESRVKRRIDFFNFSEEAEKIEEHCEPSVESDAKGERRNSTFCSTKYGEQGNSNAQREIFLRESTSRNHQELQNRQQSTNVDEKGNGEKRHRDWSIHENNCDGQNGFTPRFPQNNSSPASPQINGYPSSKIQNNNNYNDRVYSPNCGGSGSVDIEDNESFERGVPSAIEQERFRRSLENAASMVFHSRTGLPLTSSPAPLRRGSCCFDYDSSLNSVSSKRSALFELNTPPSPGAVSLEETDREVENTGECEYTRKRRSTSRSRPYSHALLGSFEESALNGRLEPVSTVHGFTAELGASGSFCPKHRKLPVTVFFYTLGDNDKVSTPYLAHINLGKKGYQVPRSGTIQVTLLNPLGTVVKMFVVLYDLSDMPPRSHTFLRQRTLRDKTLRYLVHLRFMSGKSGRIYLHTDIRMIICRKSDVDTASDFGSEPPKELRSYTHGPTNPKFSPRC